LQPCEVVNPRLRNRLRQRHNTAWHRGGALKFRNYSPLRTQRSQRKIEYQKTEAGVEKMALNELTEKIIGMAITVHRNLGTGFLESVYQAAFAYEFKQAGIRFEKEKALPVSYEDIILDVCICSGRSRPSTTCISNNEIGAKILTGHSYESLKVKLVKN